MTKETSGELVDFISTWPQFWRTAAFTFLFFLMLFGGLSLALYVFKRSGISVQSTPTGTSIQFTEFNRKVRFDTVLVSPQDWNDPQISIEKNDVVTVSAFGKVNVALGLLNESLRIQNNYRSQNESAGKGRDVGKMTADQVNDSLLVVPWNGPEGFEEAAITKEDVRETQKREASKRIIPFERMGRLIAAIVPGDKCPSNGERSKDFQLVPYFSNFTFTADRKGALCFIVNDHRSEDNKLNRLFWDDNVGFFVANIKVESK
jgi:hypothetical protein